MTSANSYIAFNTSATAGTERVRIIDNGNVGIGTTTPGAKLEVAGQVKITGGSPGAGKVLTSDAAGLASWSTVIGTTGATGANGTNGTNGTNGATGANGANGATGTNGANGANGATGANGANGATGTNGANGATGANGANGATGATNGWLLTGNAGTVDGTNFIGTTDNVPFNIRVNNVTAGRIDQTLDDTYLGYGAGHYPTTSGGSNTAIGFEALSSNTTGASNTASGYEALATNSTGGDNTANGHGALANNQVGFSNTALGADALFNNIGNTTPDGGSYNTACGVDALFSNSYGKLNTAIGWHSLLTNTTGNSNTALGSYADVSTSSPTINEATAIGYNAIVNADYKVRIGGSTCTAVEGAVSYTVSDGRFKDNITEEVKGLEFIKLLRPVVYNFNTKKFEEFLTKNMPDSIRRKHFENRDFAPSTNIRQSGFIAQEVEKAAEKVGYNFNGIRKPVNVNDNYSLAYGEFVVPLVKAVQEQQQMIDSLKTNNTALKSYMNQQDSVNTALKKQITQLAAVIATCCSANSTRPTNNTLGQLPTTLTNIDLSDKNEVVLEQNVPNPFAEQTVINYNLPDNTVKAQIIFMDQSGKLIKTVELTEKGIGTLNVFASDLSNGIYTYSLIIDGQTIETKKMIKTK